MLLAACASLGLVHRDEGRYGLTAVAETYLLQKNYEVALQEYLKVYYLYKFPHWQAPALYQAAQCDEALNEWKDAARAYEDLLRDFPESEFAAKAKERLPVARRKADG